MAISLPYALAKVLFEPLDDCNLITTESKSSYKSLIENLAEDYLRGRHLSIPTAALRGPFESPTHSRAEAEIITRCSYKSVLYISKDALSSTTAHCRVECSRMPSAVTRNQGSSKRSSPHKTKNRDKPDYVEKRYMARSRRGQKRKMIFDTPSTSHQSVSLVQRRNRVKREGVVNSLTTSCSRATDTTVPPKRSTLETKNHQAFGDAQHSYSAPPGMFREDNPSRILAITTNPIETLPNNVSNPLGGIATPVALSRAHESFQGYLDRGSSKKAPVTGMIEVPKTYGVSPIQQYNSYQNFVPIEATRSNPNTQDLYDAAPILSPRPANSPLQFREPKHWDTSDAHCHPIRPSPDPISRRLKNTSGSQKGEASNTIQNLSQMLLDTNAMESVLHNADSFLGSWNIDPVLSSASQSTLVS